VAKIDLHLHSRYSDRPSEWILRKLGVPQSYSEPEELYQKLHAAGMTFKTITDHNRIEGCLEISHHPDVFISEEVTTYFPDGCKVHLLVWNITEAQHLEIQKHRPDIQGLAVYLRSEKIPHAVTHPLTRINEMLTVDHFEKLILMFSTFEAVNSNREPLAQQVAIACLQSLTPAKIEAMSKRHGIDPYSPDAHLKSYVGGSDDHAGLYVGKAYTEIPGGATVREFFEQVAQRRSKPVGLRGDPLQLSSAFYQIVLKYALARLQKTAPLAAKLMRTMAERFLAGKNPTAFSFREKMGHLAEAVRTGQAFEFMKPGESSLTREVASFVTDAQVGEALDRIIATERSVERRSFHMASYLTNQLGYRLTTQFIRRIEEGKVIDAIQSLTGLIPAGGLLMPYLISFAHHRPDRDLLREASTRIRGEVPKELQNHKRAWFTDTLEDVNGVARTICAMAKAAQEAGHSLTVVTSRSEMKITGLPIKNFEPVGEFEIPEYKLQKMSFPPVLEMIDYIHQEGFTELIISTPGPVGLTALAAGKLLGLRMSGIYHTDFPQYARFLSDDALMESLIWSYMQWFYGQLDLIYSNSGFYRRCWIERGIPESRLEILPRGLDTELFNPKHRNESYWKNRGAKGPVLLYVGRVSKEKELAFLTEMAWELKKRGEDFTLAVVGDGPYREEMAKCLPEAIFTGILTGQELGVAYASADLFVFPSTTDTFGNVVIEAMAAGLPTLVSDVGGPRELVVREEQGGVFAARNLGVWVEGLSRWLHQLPSLEKRQKLSKSVHDERSWDRAFAVFWEQGVKK
jgi:glycosyltransferase involved in cell wall biosynthesis